MLTATDSEVHKAVEMVKAFLQGMPELDVKGPERQIVNDQFDGSATAYVLNSFEQFAESVPEPGAD